MLRFITKTIKLTLGTIVALIVALLASFGLIVVLLIQQIAHAQ